MDEKSKRITRSYYLTEEAVDKVNIFANQLSMSASEVIERMIHASVATGRADDGPIQAEDRAWANRVTGGSEPAHLVVYSLDLPSDYEVISGSWLGSMVPTDRGPVGVIVKFTVKPAVEGEVSETLRT